MSRTSLALFSLLSVVTGALLAQEALQTPAPETLLRVADQELGRLSAYDDSPRSRSRLLVFNLSRYFTAYPVPAGLPELQRFMGAADRIARDFTWRLYRGAGEAARSRQSSILEPADVEATLDGLFPSHSIEPGGFVELFRHLAAPDRLTLERADLAALGDTGFGWSSLGWLADTIAQSGETPPALSDPAARRIAEATVAYGLAVLRLGGLLAGEQAAEHVRTDHLRLAAKAVAERLQRVPADEESPRESGTPLVDVTDSSELDFRHTTSDWLSRFRRYGPPAPTFSGGGVTAGDLDGDSWPDLLFCGGHGCRSFRNRGDGTFEETTASSGLNVPGEARMAVLADFDNDGRRDVFITYARDPNRLFRNLGQGRFRDVTEASGLALVGEISGPAVAADFDNDGLLDLYVGNFGDYLRGDLPWVGADARNGMANRLFLNRGDLRFVDATESSGSGNTGWTQALSHVDFDLDGDQDLYIANDFGRNELLRNRGDGTFESAGGATGSDDPFHGMNVAFADLNGDLRPDFYVTNIWSWDAVARAPEETNSLLLSGSTEGRADFHRVGLPGDSSIDTGWSWSGVFFDADHDGDDDLFLANGLTDYATFLQFRPDPERPERLVPTSNAREPNLFLENVAGRPELPLRHGAELAGLNTRGAALLDFDRDGDLDLAVTTFHQRARLFRNDFEKGDRHWLSVELVGDPARRTNRDAIGAQLVVRGAGGLQVWRSVSGGEGYLSMSTLPIEVGLGDATEADLEILWPNGERQMVPGVAADQFVRIRQGSDRVEVLPAKNPSAP